MTLTRAASLGLAALAGYAALAIVVPGQANAATAYRYWAYYVGHGNSWQYSQRGPATEYPVDGEVQGWRFGVQVDAGNGLLPGAKPDFGTLCESTPARAGEIRVGVVIDFGLATDAPAHQKPPAGVVRGCVYVRDGGTGADVLQAAAAVRIGTGSDAGLVCGIDGYPKTECAVAVAANPALPLATPSPTPSGASPRVTASTQATTTPAATTPSVTVAPMTSAAGISPAASSPTPSAAQAPAGPPSRVSAPATASVLSLAALRSSTRHGNGALTGTIAGIVLIVVVGAGALWRSRVRGR
jgi:hypothetical protein